jgi:hypothetical protein
MGFLDGIKRKKHSDYKMLVKLHEELIDDSLRRLHPFLKSEGVISTDEFVLFCFGFNLACYVLFRKNTDTDAMEKYVTGLCRKYVMEIYGDFPEKLQDDMYDHYVQAVEEVQDQYIDTFADFAVEGKYGLLPNIVLAQIVKRRDLITEEQEDELIGRIFFIVADHIGRVRTGLESS